MIQANTPGVKTRPTKNASLKQGGIPRLQPKSMYRLSDICGMWQLSDATFNATCAILRSGVPRLSYIDYGRDILLSGESATTALAVAIRNGSEESKLEIERQRQIAALQVFGRDSAVQK